MDFYVQEWSQLNKSNFREASKPKVGHFESPTKDKKGGEEELSEY